MLQREHMQPQVVQGTRTQSPTLAWWALVAALAVALIAVACAQEEDVTPLERRAQELNRAIMCPVCPGESIDQSQNQLAAQMRGIVTQKLGQGWTENQIKDFFVERYGPSVLLEPQREGFTLLVWVLPPVGVLAAGLALYLALRMMRRAPAPQAQGAVAGLELSEEERTEYFRRIEAALESEGGGTPPTADDKVSGPGTRGVG